MQTRKDNISVRSLGYVGFGVASLSEWKKFADQLGLMFSAEDADGTLKFRMDEQSWRISIIEDPLDDILFAGFDCGDKENFENLIGQIKAAGLKINTDPDLAKKREVMELVWFEDPNSIQIELYYGPTLKPETPFVSTQPLSHFLTDDGGLGHLIVNTDDLEKTIPFYSEVLGFKFTDQILFEAAPDMVIPLTFLHCNHRHHTIAIAPKMPGSKSVHHLMLEVGGIDDVGQALDRFMSMDAEITATLGRHSNDKMLSFYVRSPSGFEVEYGCEGIALPAENWPVSSHASISVWGHKREKI